MSQGNGDPPSDPVARSLHLVRVVQALFVLALAGVAVYLVGGYALAVFVPALAYLLYTLAAAAVGSWRRRAERLAERRAQQAPPPGA
jgi:cytochrome c-type biogenesis protein CcmH/NrfG